jgi:preprotein translocase subunit YajC
MSYDPEGEFEMIKGSLFDIKLRKAAAITFFAAATLLAVPAAKAAAVTEPTYELTEETEGVEAFEVKVESGNLNVRVGRGTEYERLKYNDEYVVLHKGDLLAGFSTGRAANGGEWYEVRWVENGVEFHGYVYAPYTSKTGNKAVNIPTPTPTPTPTFTPTPTPTATNTPTPAPTATQAPETKDEKKAASWQVIAVIFVILVILGVGYYVFTRRKKTGDTEKADEKINKLKKATERAEIIDRERKLYGKSGKKKEEEAKAEQQRSNEFDDDYEMKAQPMPDEEKSALAASIREKEEIRAELNSLKYGDIVLHKNYGEGTVVDNADVNNVEIRFNNGDLRYINKDKAASQRSMRKL